MSNKKRISWLDSCRHPSHIHKTADEGLTTVCGHRPRDMEAEHDPIADRQRWKITPDVPRKIKGKSRYCRECFKDGGKSLPFVEKFIITAHLS